MAIDYGIKLYRGWYQWPSRSLKGSGSVTRLGTLPQMRDAAMHQEIGVITQK
jgi:hypothetical protein